MVRKEYFKTLFVCLFIIFALIVVVSMAASSGSMSAPGISYGHNTLEISLDRYTYKNVSHDRAIFVDKADGNILSVPLDHYTIDHFAVHEAIFNLVEDDSFDHVKANGSDNWKLMTEKEFLSR